MVDIYLKNSDKRFTVTKDPNATLDYTWDWSDYLTAISDTIATAVIIVDSTLNVVSTAVVGTNRVVGYISGGTTGVPAKAVCRITTVGGRTDDRTIFFNVIER